MKKNTPKKAQPVTMKSSGTDDPSKYVGGWESYDKPQGIGSRRDKKVLAMEDVQDWNGKSVVWSDGQYYVAVDDITGATYITAWTSDNKRIGHLSTRMIPGYRNWLSVRDVELDKKARGSRIGYRMYQALLHYMSAEYQGIAGYMPDMANKKQVPAIYRRLGGKVDPDNADVILVPRRKMNESFTKFAPEIIDEPDELLISPEDKKAIRQSAKAPRKLVRSNVKALSARGKPAQLDPRKLQETIRRPFVGNLNTEYEIVDDNDRSIGFVEVVDSVIQNLDYIEDATQSYRGQILSALMHQITLEADHTRANLSIEMAEPDYEIKTMLERFGFRLVGGNVFRRNNGSIRPPSVTTVQGL